MPGCSGWPSPPQLSPRAGSGRGEGVHAHTGSIRGGQAEGSRRHARARLARRQVWERMRPLAPGGGHTASPQPTAGPPGWGGGHWKTPWMSLHGGGPGQAGGCCNAARSAMSPRGTWLRRGWPGTGGDEPGTPLSPHSCSAGQPGLSRGGWMVLGAALGGAVLLGAVQPGAPITALMASPSPCPSCADRQRSPERGPLPAGTADLS